MKRFFLFFIVLSVLFSSCKKDNDETNSSSSCFTYKNSKYGIAKGYLIGWGESNSTSVYSKEIYLVSSGITCTSNSSSYNISGTGNSIYFSIYSTSETAIEPGTYTYSESTSYPITNTFDYCEVDLNSNWDLQEENGTWAEITSGTLTISKSGSIYEIAFEGFDSNNNKVVASYNGTLGIYNMSFNKKK